VTLILGMRHEEGVLIGGDTLVTVGAGGYFDSKIVGYHFDGGEAIFALSGNVGLAHSAIQQCEVPLERTTGGTHREIAQVISDALVPAYGTHILANSFQYTDYDYNLIVAVRSANNGAALYRSHLGTLTRSVRGFECSGMGQDVADFFIRHMFGQRISQRAAWKVAAYAMATAKAALRASVGGRPIMLTLKDSGEVLDYDYTQADAIERFAPWVDWTYRELLTEFWEDNNADFRLALQAFGEKITAIREVRKNQASQAMLPAVHPRARQIMTDLRSPH